MVTPLTMLLDGEQNNSFHEVPLLKYEGRLIETPLSTRIFHPSGAFLDNYLGQTLTISLDRESEMSTAPKCWLISRN